MELLKQFEILCKELRGELHRKESEEGFYFYECVLPEYREGEVDINIEIKPNEVRVKTKERLHLAELERPELVLSPEEGVREVDIYSRFDFGKDVRLIHNLKESPPVKGWIKIKNPKKIWIIKDDGKVKITIQ